MIVGLCAPAQGALVDFYNIDFTSGGTLAGITYTKTQSFLSDNGVSFDATVTVTGSSIGGSDNIGQTPAQGLDTGDQPGMQIGDSLALTFSINNVSGGTILDQGFYSAVLNSGAGNWANFSASTGLGDFEPVGIGPDQEFVFATPAPTFSVAGSLISFGNPGFYLQGISLRIATTPEPASLAMMGVAGLAFAGIGCRRRRSSHSATSPVDLNLVS